MRPELALKTYNFRNSLGFCESSFSVQESYNMKYPKIAPVQFLVLTITVAVYITLLIMSFNKHSSTKPTGVDRSGDDLDIDKTFKSIAHEWRNVPLQRLSNRNAGDAVDDERESSVSGDSAGYGDSSDAVFSGPFAYPDPNIRRIYPKTKHKSQIYFKSPWQLNISSSNSLLNTVNGTFSHKSNELSPSKISNKELRLSEKNEDEPCIAHRNIVFVKTHKTASSTLQNIFYRFGDERNLTFALPARDVYIESVREFQVASILPTLPGTHFNIMANHVRFFYKDIKKLMPPDTKFITIVRQSSSQFRSMYTYYVMESQFKATVEQYSLNPKYYYEKFGIDRFKRHNGRDPQLFDLGMEKSSCGDPRSVSQYIQFLDSKLDMVLIREYFYESLILLKDLLCWDLRSLVHVNNKIKVSLASDDATMSGEEQRASDDVNKRLDRWNIGDVMLYDHFNKTLWRKIDAYGRSRMSQEVRQLRQMCENYKVKCMNGTKIRDISRGSLQQIGLAEYVVKPAMVNNMTCRRLSWVPKTFLSHLRRKHIDTFHRRIS